MGSLPLCDDEHLRQPWLPPGFRFHPTDEELLAFYLSKKIEDAHFTVPEIAEADLSKNEPWELPASAGRATMAEKEWYFYSVRSRKYPTGVRANRATQAGYWKATGKDREVINTKSGGRLLGLKKTLVFYMGRRAGGQKTDWVMHEYNKMDAYVKVHEWVLCRVFFKRSQGKKDVMPKLQETFSGSSYATITNDYIPLLERQISNTHLSSPITFFPTITTPLSFLDVDSSSSYSLLKFSSHNKIPKDILPKHNCTLQDFEKIPFTRFIQENFVSATHTHVEKDLLTRKTPQMEEKLQWKEFDSQRSIEITTPCRTSQNMLIDFEANPPSTKSNHELELSPFHSGLESTPWCLDFIE